MDASKKYLSLLVIVLGFSILSYILEEARGFLYGDEMRYAVLGIGLLSLIIPIVGDWVVKGWFKLAFALGWINGRILLSVVFYIFLFPIALLYKMFNKNSLQRKKEQGGSVFTERNHQYKPKDLENVW